MACVRRLRLSLCLSLRPALPLRVSRRCLCSRSDTVKGPQQGRKRAALDRFKTRVSSGPTLQDFVKGGDDVSQTPPEEQTEPHAYLSEDLDVGNDRKVCFETYGCQMNVNDTEIAWSILQQKGYQRTGDLNEVQNPDSPKERSSSSTGERYEAKSYTKRLQKELTTGPQTLIVGDGAVNKTKHFFGKNTKVLCFTNDMVSDISQKILEITAEHPTVKSLVIHTGALDVAKQQSEVLKRDFNDLLNKVRCLNTEVSISGPLPTVRRGDERFSRLLMLNRWLKDTCAAQSVNFIDNFNIFWERRHLFEADGFCLNKDKAEQTIWNRLQQLTAMKRKRLKTRAPMKIGVLGCMAERLKTELLEREKLVDVLAGPDAYRDLPRLLTVADGGRQASNVLLSLEETYADVMPVHRTPQGYSAFVSIMRGCDNMCSYCIVPFTRGRERSRPVSSILDEGVKEVTLLGQNVNSYRDTSEEQYRGPDPTQLSRGFRTLYRSKQGGLRFADLLDRVSRVDPDMRIRFTSPHPKDFPDEVLQLIEERGNVCKQIHLPAQSGSSQVLKAMRRGYTREAYLDLVENIKRIVPGVSLSSDFIAGFCGEMEEDHLQTLSLIREVGYNVGFLFAYSMRKKTHASHALRDDVPSEVKQRRLEELISTFREEAARVNSALVGTTQLVLVEGESKRSAQDLCGRSDGNVKVIFPRADIRVDALDSGVAAVKAGDYVLVKILSANSQSLQGRALSLSSLSDCPVQRENLIGQQLDTRSF
ncbi:CDK5 regulatory subunit-associated protein 1 [Merluccius polli]|uniref:Mitochondrial tRNA methylthiotransferase CDK5RAP1 n=1 Tax=Merluccius polli TaxID=89951 RepID=A0AA47PBX3_MERPO|nr:CDK5 regulatory subunit-associated protein 1 [Merluccius polli]